MNDLSVDSLRNSYIYFSSPEQLNDPFDCQVDIRSAIQAAIDACDGRKADVLVAIASAETLFAQIQEDMKSFGVFSLTQNPTNSVMWSQYGDKHRGICLTYDIPDDFIIDAATNILGRAPVLYGDEPITDWLIQNAETVDFDDPRDFAIELMKRVLTVKAADWNYEREYRILRTESGPLSIPNEFLAQVCFGLRISEADKMLVDSALSKAGSGAVRVRAARTASNFRLELIEI